MMNTQPSNHQAFNFACRQWITPVVIVTSAFAAVATVCSGNVHAQESNIQIEEASKTPLAKMIVVEVGDCSTPKECS